VPRIDRRINRSSDALLQIAKEWSDCRQRCRSDHHQIDVAGRAFGSGRHRAINKCDVNLILEWPHSLFQRLNDADRLKKDLPELAEYGTSGVRLEVHSIAVSTACQYTSFAEELKLAL